MTILFHYSGSHCELSIEAMPTSCSIGLSLKPMMFRKLIFINKGGSVYMQKKLFTTRCPPFCHLENKHRNDCNDPFQNYKFSEQFKELDHSHYVSKLHNKHLFKNWFIHKRNLSTCSVLNRGESIFYLPSKRGTYKTKEKLSAFQHVKRGIPLIKPELKKFAKEMKKNYDNDLMFLEAGDKEIMYKFKTQEDLDQWIVSSDSDHKEGFSHGSLTFSPAGHALFSGEIDSRIPKDGDVKSAGYCAMNLIQPMASFMRPTRIDVMPYSHLILRVRGDGRRYLVTLNTSGYYDISWWDCYSYVLYTRGGPYWQYSKIPFSKFFLSAGGRVQDKQSKVPRYKISSLGITSAEQLDSPFRLEIDYIGFQYDPTHTEEFAYEGYKLPQYII